MQHATGGSADDLLVGSSGNNTLMGGEGSDTYKFSGGWGTDTIEDDGSEGIDTLDFSAVTANLTVTIQADDKVSITDGTITLEDAEGIETIIGGSGSDVFTFENGAKILGTLDGGIGGANKLDYSLYTTAVTVDLAAGKAVAANITTTVAHFTNMTGGSDNDTLTGDAGANRLEGGAGNDVLKGGAGNDTLVGGTGDDTYVLTPGGGTETITEAVDAGTDTLDYSGYTTPIVWNVAGGPLPGVNTSTNVEKVILAPARMT